MLILQLLINIMNPPHKAMDNRPAPMTVNLIVVCL